MIISRTFPDTLIQFLLISHWYTSVRVSVYLLCVKKVKVSVALSCPSLCNPIDYSQSGSSDHGILQARILEWVAIPFIRDSYFICLHSLLSLIHFTHYSEIIVQGYNFNHVTLLLVPSIAHHFLNEFRTHLSFSNECRTYFIPASISFMSSSLIHGIVKPSSTPQINAIISHIHNFVYTIHFIFTSPSMLPINIIAIRILLYSIPSIKLQCHFCFPWVPNLYRSFIALTISFFKQRFIYPSSH